MNPLKWPIEHRILAGFVLVFAVLLAIGWVSYTNTTKYHRNSEADAMSREVLQVLDLSLATIENADIGLRRFLVTGEGSYLTAYQTAQQRTPVYLRHMKDLLQDYPGQLTRLDQLNQLIEKVVEAGQAAITLRTQTDFEGVRHLLRLGREDQDLMALRQVMEELEGIEKDGLRRRATESLSTTRSTIFLLAIGTMLQFVLLSAVYYLIRHDINERRQVAAELESRGEQLETANKELEAFSYSVSHDLRAPLRHIDGYASLLKKNVGPSLDEKSSRFLQTISDSAKHMGKLIDDLLVFSRMGRSDMANTPVNLDLLVKEALHGLQDDMQGRSITWSIGSLPVVKADPSMLRQVMVNLIANAVKFTSTRELAKIEVGSYPGTDGETVVFVRDNGVGFDMQYAAKLFGVFQRLHRAEEFEGTGIGLANVRRIIHRHGGHTWAESALGEGATFYFSLPNKENA